MVNPVGTTISRGSSPFGPHPDKTPDAGGSPDRVAQQQTSYPARSRLEWQPAELLFKQLRALDPKSVKSISETSLFFRATVENDADLASKRSAAVASKRLTALAPFVETVTQFDNTLTEISNLPSELKEEPLIALAGTLGVLNYERGYERRYERGDVQGYKRGSYASFAVQAEEAASMKALSMAFEKIAQRRGPLFLVEKIELSSDNEYFTEVRSAIKCMIAPQANLNPSQRCNMSAALTLAKAATPGFDSPSGGALIFNLTEAVRELGGSTAENEFIFHLSRLREGQYLNRQQ